MHPLAPAPLGLVRARPAPPRLARALGVLLALAPNAACAAPPPPLEVAVDGLDPDDPLLAADADSIAIVTRTSVTLVARQGQAGQAPAVWTKPLPSWAPSPPVFHGTDVLVATFDGHLLAYRRSDGTLASDTAFDTKFFGSGVVVENTFYIGGDHELLAIDLAALTPPGTPPPAANSPNRAVRWRTALSPKWNVTAPVVAGGLRLYLLVGEDILALDAATGAIAWRHPVTSYAGGDHQAPVLVTGARVISGTPTKHLVAVAAATGDDAWAAGPAHHTWSDRLDVTPYLLGSNVCFSHVSIEALVDSRSGPSGRYTARATCVDPESGAVRWSTDLPLADKNKDSGVAASPDKLWIAYDGALIGFDPDDGAQTRVALPPSLAGAPVHLATIVGNQAVVVGPKRLALVRVP